MTKKEFITTAPEYFEKLDPIRINQGLGRYMEECGCCIGAHLFHLLADEEGEADNSMWAGESDHIRGVKQYAYLLGLSISDLEHRLMQHGASHIPFSAIPWSKPPYEVLAAVERELIQERANA